MSTAQVDRTPGTAAVDVSRPGRPSLAVLTVVELRKMTNTRAGRWLLGVIALTGLVMVAVVLFAAPPEERRVLDLYSASLTGVAVLLPILGVLSVTGEWSQRTALTTFTLVPTRERVVAAKLLAGAVLSAVAVVVCLLATYLGRVAGGLLDRTPAGWSLPPSVIGTTLLFCAVSVAIGVAFGMVFLSSPLAIVMYFLLPIVWSTLGETVRALDRAAGWLDTNRTLNPLFEPGVTGPEWGRVGTSLALWLLVPLLAGLVRVLRSEIK